MGEGGGLACSALMDGGHWDRRHMRKSAVKSCGVERVVRSWCLLINDYCIQFSRLTSENDDTTLKKVT